MYLFLENDWIQTLNSVHSDQIYYFNYHIIKSKFKAAQ